MTKNTTDVQSSEKLLKEPATSTTTSIKGKGQQIWFPELSPYITETVQFSTMKNGRTRKETKDSMAHTQEKNSTETLPRL